MLTQELGCDVLPIGGFDFPPYRTDCFGWADTPLDEAADQLTEELGVSFWLHSSVHLGLYYHAALTGVDIRIRDNYAWDLPRHPDEEDIPLESRSPTHVRLVYVEGEVLSWIELLSAKIRQVPGLVELYSIVEVPPAPTASGRSSLPSA